MKQRHEATKDALFTILHDLRPQDRFNIIGFSNRVKVWKDHLVSVTPNNIRDGKVYIHHMSPTGGKRASCFAHSPRRDTQSSGFPNELRLELDLVWMEFRFINGISYQSQQQHDLVTVLLVDRRNERLDLIL
ncbi:hypothetical protein J1605_005164 [Eschrichtius robustus]|uniref:VWFA domain-containing protein n=1 Tax=Eschrichtius robustus TaxID=9764 RepID=A0AB34H9M5_ESCRO|nr:hypothetical protein J1605_005164 [Eschrichtius robustus]